MGQVMVKLLAGYTPPYHVTFLLYRGECEERFLNTTGSDYQFFYEVLKQVQCGSEVGRTSTNVAPVLFLLPSVVLCQVVVNLTPTESDPVAPPLKSMHKAEGCGCLDLKREVLINHYLGSRGDYLERVHRYWSVRYY